MESKDAQDMGLYDVEPITLEGEARDKFLEMLENPPPPNEKLIELFHKHADLVKEPDVVGVCPVCGGDYGAAGYPFCPACGSESDAELNPCKCVDCGGDEPDHSPDCTWMKELHGESDLGSIEEETQFKLQVSELFSQPELQNIPDLHKIKDNYFQGRITREEFESLFNSTFAAYMKEKQEQQREDHMLAAYLGLTLSEFEQVHAKNERIHVGMDLKDHYVEIIRKDGEVEGHVHARKRYPDGTVRLYFMDLNPLEKKQYMQFIDLLAYHDDGEINIEMTAAMHEAYQDRRLNRFIEKSGRRVPVMPKDPTGRNDKCPCGSGLKYKKCCLPKQGDIIRGMTVAEAMRVYGKDIFDIQPEPEIEDTNDSEVMYLE